MPAQPAPKAPNAPLSARELRDREQALDAFGRRADRVLRAAYGNAPLWRLLQAAPGKASRSQVRLMLAPSPLVMALTLPLLLWIGLTQLLPALLVASGAQGAAQTLYGLPSLPWWSLPLVALALWWLDRVLLPRIGLARYQFRLMRLERHDEGSEHPAVFRASGLKGETGGFGWQSWRSLPGVERGDLLIAVADAQGDGIATIQPKLAGRSPIMLWRQSLWLPDALPAAPESLRSLAEAFDAACTDHDSLLDALQRRDRTMRLRSGQLADDTPQHSEERAWETLVLAPALEQPLRRAAQALNEGSTLAPRGILLHGPPGTGKSMIAKVLADSSGCAFFALTPADLKAQHLGGSAARVNELWRKARSKGRALIFVDECDTVFARRGGLSSDGVTEELLGAFLAEWDGLDKQPRITVVAATNRRDRLDPAILSRFDLDLHVDLPGNDERRRLLALELGRFGLNGVDVDSAAQATGGLSGRELANLCRQLARGRIEGSAASITAGEIDAALGEQRRRGASITGSQARWETLVLPDATVRELRAVAGLLQHAETFRSRGIEPPRGLLLHGPPGTGKTQIARTLAAESGLGFIGVTTADLKQGYLGQSGQKVREMFQRARESAPCVLFIDEIDALASARGEGQDSFQGEIVGQLLQEMDGVFAQTAPVFVLAATNRIDTLDSALISRFPKRLLVDLPDAAARTRILRVLLAGKPLQFELDAVIAAWAADSTGSSGRDLRSWIEAAELSAVARAMDAGTPERVALAIEDFPQR